MKHRRNLGILRRELANVSVTFWMAAHNPLACSIQILSSPFFAPEYETLSSDFMIDRFVTYPLMPNLIALQETKTQVHTSCQTLQFGATTGWLADFPNPVQVDGNINDCLSEVNF